MNTQSVNAELQSRPLLALVAAWLCFFIGAGCLFMVGLMIWKGGIWAKYIYVAKPLHNLASAAAAFLAWHVLRTGIGRFMQTWKAFTAKVVLLSVSTALTCLTAEIGMRLYFQRTQMTSSLQHLKELKAKGKPIPFHSTHPLAYIIEPSTNHEVVYELQPNLNLDFGHHELVTNKEGMRQRRNYPHERSTNTVRIVGIGDSGMFGWNLDENQNYLSVLESNLNSRTPGPACEVLNLAVPGYNTQLEVASLKSKGLVYKPDIVVVGWCDNDFDLPFFMWESQKYWRKDVSYLYCLLFDRNKFEEITPLKFRDQREFDKAQVRPELISGTNIEGVRHSLQELKELGAAHNFKILIFGPMNEVILKLCKEVDLPYYNTIEKIPDGKYPDEYAVHYMHPRLEGHRVLGEHLAEELNQRGWLKPTSVR